MDANSVAGDAQNRLRNRYPVVARAVLAVTAFVLLGIIFYKAQTIGGEAWDESADLAGTAQQLDVAGRWLAGDRNAHFSQVQSNWAFYGIAATLPAHLARVYAVQLGSANGDDVARYTLHATTFACYLLNLLLTYLILIRATGRPIVAAVGSALLALYPVWLGQAFFNHKDVPTAAFATLALYGAIGVLQANEERRTIMKFAAVLAVATILIAGLKIAALVLILPSWIAAGYALLRGRYFGFLLTLPLLSTLGILAVTPVAWSDPLNFIVATIGEMAHHRWNGCTLTAGYCIRPHSPEWSAWRYLLAWFLAQTPLLIGFGAIAAIVTAVRKGAVARTVAASAVLPLFLIVAMNATVYDGLRHVLFEFPLIFILGVMFWSEIASRAGYSAVGLFAALQICLFIWDNVALFPYNYVYFNLPSRQIANHYNFVTDFWGFSLKEAAELPIVVQSDSKIVLGYPGHLVAPFVPSGRATIDLGNASQLPPATEVVTVAYVRFVPVPEWCSNPEYITRQLPLGGWPLQLSYAARCVTQ